MYIPLWNVSNYTLLSSLLKIDDIIAYAKKNHLPSISIADTNMYGTMEFIKKCEKENINPVIGLEIKVEGTTLVVFAKNYKGYQSLIKLSTIQNEHPLTKQEVEEHNQEVIAVVPFDSKASWKMWETIFRDSYLAFTKKEEEKEAYLETNRVIFFPKNVYGTKEDQVLLPYLYRIRDGKTISEEMDYDLVNHELERENPLSLSDNTGIVNTLNLTEKCKIEFPPFRNLLPIYECEDPKAYLFELCKAGLNKRLNQQVPKIYQDRLLYELKVINDMGFANYFLIVYDFIKYAKKNKILVGPGRGSAAGSLVAYTLGITDIDPLKYDLLFERFLNPERKTMPDIDTDFPDNKRDLVIQYVKEKYGEKRVAGIITFGTMAAKQVLRDVARVLNVPAYKVDSLVKLIPEASKHSLKEIYEENKTFQTRVASDTILSDLYKIACRLEGFPRHTSQHAAGIVMSCIDLDEVIPLQKIDNLYLTSYSMEYLEELGLLKMDFLVIKNLTLIDNILTDIKKIEGKEIDFAKIPLDDKETIKLFETANTCGIFQFESSGMRSFLKRLRPNTFEDIVAAIALFRPGAAVNIDSYIKRKHKEEKIEYLDPSLEEITKNTYGFLIYQEQIMQAASTYAGYTLGEADILRRAMSKKKEELLKNEEEKFIKKSLERNHKEEQARKIFNLILNFAGYGFNKSHSVVYSVVAYKMAYLKCYYKTIFFANLLTNVIGSETKTSEYIQEARKNNIEIVKPTINDSKATYQVKEDKIIYPLSNIKSIGVVVCEALEKAKQEGPFQDIYDCLSRLYIAGVGKKTIETLIYADVFQEFGYNRRTLIDNLDSLFNYAELTKDIDPSLVMKPEIERKKEYDEFYLLEKEKEVFGFYLTAYPTSIYKEENPYCIPIKEIENHYNQTIDTIVIVEKIKAITTKKGDKMAFLSCSDETGMKEFILFPKAFSQIEQIEKGMVVKIRGKVEKRLNEIQVIVEKIKSLQGEEHEE